MENLIKNRRSLVKKARDIIGEAEMREEDLSGEEEARFDEILGKVKDITEKIEAEMIKVGRRVNSHVDYSKAVNFEQLLEDLKNPTSEAIYASSDYQDSSKRVLYNKDSLIQFRDLIRGQGKILSPYKSIDVGKYFKGLLSGDWRGAQNEWQLRAITETTGSGLVFVPEEISSYVIYKALNAAQTVNAGCQITPMSSKTKVIPRQTSDVATEWKNESVAFASSKDITFEGLELSLHTLMSLIELSVELSEDSKVGDVVKEAMANKLSVELDNAILNGATNGIEGILNTVGIQEETYTAAAFDYSVISKAYSKLLAANCKAENIAMLIDSSLLGELDLLTDTTNQPIQPPESYRNIKVFPTNQLTDVALIGDFTQCILGVKRTMNANFTNLGRGADVETSREALTAFEKLTVLIRGYLRADAGVRIPDHFCKMTVATP